MTSLQFQPGARAQIVRPKVLLYGDIGTGKTRTILRLAQLTSSRLALIDTEHGVDTYRSEFGAFFQDVQTTDPGQVEAVVDGLLAKPSNFSLFAIDPISNVHDQMLANADAELRRRRGSGKGRSVDHFEAAVDVGTHQRIGMLSKTLQRKIRLLDMATIVTSHEKVDYQQGGGAGASLRAVGVKPEGHKSLDRLFDLVLRLRVYGQRRVATVDKARGVNIKTGATIEDFSAQHLVGLFPPGSWAGKAEATPLVSADQARELHELIQRAGLAAWQVTKALLKRGADTVELLGQEHFETTRQSLWALINQKETRR